MDAQDSSTTQTISRERFLEPNQKITAQETLELLRNGRSETVDWLPGRAQVSDIAAVLVAMANSHGGTVALGVAPRTDKPAGIDDLPELLGQMPLEGQLT